MNGPPNDRDRPGAFFRAGSTNRTVFDLAGFTVVEIAIAVMIAGILAAIAIPKYLEYVEKTKIYQCIADIKELGQKITKFDMEMGIPNSLSVLEGYPFIDPWGNPYRFLNLTTDSPPAYPNARRDRNNHPLSTDFDLYSMGADGRTVKPVSVSFGKDDIIRADNGRYIGMGVNY